MDAPNLRKLEVFIMARSDGTVYIDTQIDTNGFGNGVNRMQRQVGSLGNAFKKLGGIITATFAIGKLIQFGKEAVDLGSDLQEVQNVVDVTFSSMSEAVNEFAKNADETAGISETMAKRYAGTFGAMAKAFGFAEEESFAMSTALTQLAGDVASFYNITQDEAYTKLKSVFTGETESLKDLGVVMTQSALDSFAMAKGYEKTTREMSEQEKVALRYSFVLEQLSTAQGDFARTSDSWANQTRILSLNFDTFKANIGQSLINIFTPFLKIINQIVARLAELSKHFVAFSELISGKTTSSGGGSSGEALADIESGYENIADATNEATKAQNKYLTGLDEIKTFQTMNGDESSANVGIGAINPTDVENTNKELSNTESLIEKVINKIKDLIRNEDWRGLGEYLSSGIVAAFDFISEKLEEFDWEGLGNAIGEFLAGIKWTEVLSSFGRIFWEAITGVIDFWGASFEAAPIETAIITAILALKWTGLGGALLFSLKNSLKRKISLVSFGGIFSGILSGGIPVLGTPAFDSIGNWIWDGISDALDKLLPDGVFDFLSKLGAGLVVGAAAGSWFPGAGTVVGAIIGAITGALDGIKIEGGKSILGLIFEKLFNFDDAKWWFDKALESFQTAFDGHRQDWFDIGSYIVEGIGEGLLGGLIGLVEPIADLFMWTYEEICKVFGIHSPAKEMMPLGENILLGIVEGFRTMFSSFSNAINEFWNKYVSPWFSKEKWNGFLNSIPEAFKEAFKNAANGAIGFLNGVLSGIEKLVNESVNGLSTIGDAVNLIPGVNIDFNNIKLSIPKIPLLATGAVIPPNAPFMAMLGDQKHGTNIEAPLETIKQAVREVVGNGGGGQYAFTAQINRRTLFEEMIDEAKLRQSTSGRNPFDLA